MADADVNEVLHEKSCLYRDMGLGIINSPAGSVPRAGRTGWLQDAEVFLMASATS